MVQFSWAPQEEVARIAGLASELKIQYFNFRVFRKPQALLGAVFSIYRSLSPLKQLIESLHIDVVMPRSTMPAFLCNRLGDWLTKKGISTVFDLDGFALQERVDFAGWNPSGPVYRFLLAEEDKLLGKSKVILTRSEEARQLLFSRLPALDQQIVFKVSNGRDALLFNYREELREEIRSQLGFGKEDWVWVYTGSIGPPYALEALFKLLEYALEKGRKVYVLVISRNSAYLQKVLPEKLKDRVKVVETEFRKVPHFLAAGDLGISLRTPAPSLKGLFPIKLGEYLLTGLPVLAALQVGDTRHWVGKVKGIIGVDLTDPDVVEKTIEEAVRLGSPDRVAIRESALEYFSIDRSIADYTEAFKGL